MTDDLTADELEYLKREQTKFEFYRKIEAKQQDSETPLQQRSIEPSTVAP